MVIPILKALLVVVIMGVMILVLLGINHIFSGNFNVNEAEVDNLREDLKKSEDVISDHGVFTELVKVSDRRSK